jgi:hypothetical protein
MKLDPARIAAASAKALLHRTLQDVVTRLREAIIQNDDQGADHEYIKQSKAEWAVNYCMLVWGGVLGAPGGWGGGGEFRANVCSTQASALQDELTATLSALGMLCTVCKYECVHAEPYQLTKCSTCSIVVHCANEPEHPKQCSYKLSKWSDAVVCMPCARSAVRVDLTAD